MKSKGKLKISLQNKKKTGYSSEINVDHEDIYETTSEMMFGING